MFVSLRDERVPAAGEVFLGKSAELPNVHLIVSFTLNVVVYQILCYFFCYLLNRTYAID